MNATPLPGFTNPTFVESKNIPLRNKPFAVLGNDNYCYGYQEGGLAEIYFVGGKNDSKPLYALKTFKKKLFYNPISRKSFIKEASLWLRLSGQPYIFPVIGILKIDGFPYITMPIAVPNKRGEITLRDTLNKKGKINSFEKYRCIYELVSGLYFATKEIPNLIHGDLKPENILYFQDDCHIADFGLANNISIIDDSTEFLQSTPAYKAPELDDTKVRPTIQSDMFALGLIILEILLGEDVLEIKRKYKVDPAFISKTIQILPNELKRIIDCIKIILQPDPLKRFQDYNEFYKAIVKAGSESFGEKFKELFMKTFKLTQFAEYYQAQSFNNLIESLIHLNEYDIALTIFETKDKSLLNRETWQLYGTILSLNNEDEKALLAFDKAAEYPMDNDQKALLQIEKALSFKRLKRFKDALSIFEYYRTRVSDNLRANVEINLGATYFEMKDYKRAITEMEHYVRKNEAVMEAWAILGQANLKIQQYEKATIYFKRCLTIDPGNGQIQISLGEALFHQKMINESYYALNAAADQGYTDHSWFKYVLACQILLGRGDDMDNLVIALKQNDSFDETEEKKLMKDAIDLITKNFPEYSSTKTDDSEVKTSAEELEPYQELNSETSPPTNAENLSTLSLPFVNGKVDMSVNMFSLDFYQKTNHPEFINEFVDSYKQVDKEHVFSVNSATSLYSIAFYFTECTNCWFKILTNIKQGRTINCRNCKTKFKSGSIDNPTLSRMLSEIESRLQKHKISFKGKIVFVVVQAMEEEQLNEIESSFITAGYTKIISYPYFIYNIFQKGIQRDIFSIQDTFLVFNRLCESSVLQYEGDTPLELEEFIAGLRINLGGLKSVSVTMTKDDFDSNTLMTGTFEERINYLKRIDSVSSLDYRNLIVLANDLINLKKTAESKQYLERAFQMVPEDDEINILFAKVELIDKNYQNALPYLLTFYRKNPVDRYNLSLLVSAYHNLKDSENYKKYYHELDVLGGPI